MTSRSTGRSWRGYTTDLPRRLRWTTSRHAISFRLEDVLDSGEAVVQEIPGARDLLAHLHSLPGIALGMATANFREAARIRLERLGMWDYVKEYPGAAEYEGV